MIVRACVAMLTAAMVTAAMVPHAIINVMVTAASWNINMHYVCDGNGDYGNAGNQQSRGNRVNRSIINMMVTATARQSLKSC